jgi:hypothetical protein
MAEDFLETLRASDPAVLTEVVRQDERSPTFDITGWTVERLSDQGLMNPDSLFLFRGEGSDEQGARSWSVVLKILKQPEGEQPEASTMWYWKREYLAAQSGLFERLPPSVVTPRFYHLSEQEGSAWLWMEHVVASTGKRWTRDHYALAARQIGRFNGVYLTGTPLPDDQWLCKGHARLWTSMWSPVNVGDNPYISRYYTAQQRERVLRLWDDRECFLDTLDRLPQAFSHFDFQRRNLFIRQTQDGSDEVVAIDWALCGNGPVGGDLSMLMGMSAGLFELELTTLPELDKAVFEAYVTGLRDVGWDGSPELVRLGYTAWFALWIGLTSPAVLAMLTSDDMLHRIPQTFGRPVDQFVSDAAALCEYALDRADEARILMDLLM